MENRDGIVNDRVRPRSRLLFLCVTGLIRKRRTGLTQAGALHPDARAGGRVLGGDRADGAVSSPPFVISPCELTPMSFEPVRRPMEVGPLARRGPRGGGRTRARGGREQGGGRRRKGRRRLRTSLSPLFLLLPHTHWSHPSHWSPDRRLTTSACSRRRDNARDEHEPASGRPACPAVRLGEAQGEEGERARPPGRAVRGPQEEVRRRPSAPLPAA